MKPIFTAVFLVTIGLVETVALGMWWKLTRKEEQKDRTKRGIF